MDRKQVLLAAVAALGLAGGEPAAAQLHLPQLPPLQLPRLPAAPDLPPLAAPAARPLEDVLDRRDLVDLRRLKIRELLERHPRRIEADPAGEPIVRNRLVVLSPPAAALEAARAEGFGVERERALEAIGQSIVVLRTPPGMTTAAALARLRSLDPQRGYDFDHLYLPAGAPPTAAAPARAVVPPSPGRGTRGSPRLARIGLIDGGVDLRHPALIASDIHIHGCGGELVPDAHATGVASLLVGRAPGFAGAAPGAELYAADVYCGQPTGGSAATIVEALAWMAREQVPVINVSLVGPANRALERALRILMAHGHLVVAAVGNDGPAAPPLYPAAYAGVIGVTAVDLEEHVLPEAARGPQVAFAAPGDDLAVARSGGRGYATARGTSFAAPLVAGLLATAAGPALPIVEPASARRRVVERLAAGAIDLGAPGRDDIYGYGLLGERLRVDPRALR